MLNDLLSLLKKKIDFTNCVSVMRKKGFISLIEPFLKSVQFNNNAAVNEAVNEIYLEN